MKKTIYIDMDDTLLDTSGSMIWYAQKLINKLGMGITLSNALNKKYSFIEMLIDGGLKTSEAVLLRYMIFKDITFWENISFNKDAYEYFKKLYDNPNFDVYIATSVFLSCSDEVIIGKKNFIQNNMPWFDLKKLIYSHAKYKLHGDFMIEDVPSQLKEFNGTKILFDQPHNQGDFPEMIRVKDWKEVYTTIYDTCKNNEGE